LFWFVIVFEAHGCVSYSGMGKPEASRCQMQFIVSELRF